MTMRPLIIALLTTLVLGWPQNQARAGSFFKTTAADGSVVFSDVRPGGKRKYKRLTKEPNRSKARYRCVGENSPEMDKRIATIVPVIKRYASQYNVSPDLVKAIARVESCFDKDAISRAGAQGLMQLMPGTAKIYGVRNPFDIDQNIRAGVKYFADLKADFNSDLRLSLAAYNAGPGAVNKYGGIPPYAETQKYVSLVIEKYKAYATDTN